MARTISAKFFGNYDRLFRKWCMIASIKINEGKLFSYHIIYNILTQSSLTSIISENTDNSQFAWIMLNVIISMQEGDANALT